MKKTQLVFLFLAVFLTGILCSCSDSDSGIRAVNQSLVFDYSKNSSVPDVYLSVFVQPANEAQRAEKITVTELKTDRKWIITNPEKISNRNKNWAGWSRLHAAEGERFNAGKYHILYEDAAGDESEAEFNLALEDSFFVTSFEDIPKKTTLTLSRQCALYDKDMNMIFYGPVKSTWTNGKQIKKDHQRSEKIRYSLTNSNGSLIFLKAIEDIYVE